MTQITQEKQKGPKRAVFTKESKIFIKAKLMVSKNCPLKSTCFLICCILEDAHLQNLSFLSGLSTEFISFQFFWHCHISQEAWESKLEIVYFFLDLLSENSHSASSKKIIERDLFWYIWTANIQNIYLRINSKH